MLPLSYIGMLCQGEDLSYMNDFSTLDWALSIGVGISTVLSQTSRAKAVHYEEPARLTVLNYFQSVIQLLMDVIFLSTHFSLL
jgi:drug/metabolite transporter (DMT)-like permease